MSKNSFISKTIASIFGTLTILVIGSLVFIVIFYNMELNKIDPTPPPTAPVTTLAPPPVMRLPGDVIPESYKVFIQVHLYTRIIEEVNITTPNQTLFFSGNSTVHFECVQKTMSIYLHSRHQSITKALVMVRDTNKYLKVNDIILHEDQSDFLEIKLNEALEARMNYSLFLAFLGNVNENLEGLFLSTYQEGNPEYEGDTDVER